jgi:hypothetical protein
MKPSLRDENLGVRKSGANYLRFSVEMQVAIFYPIYAVSKRFSSRMTDESIAAIILREFTRLIRQSGKFEPGSSQKLLKVSSANRRGVAADSGREAACPRSGPVEGVWGNREVRPTT